MRTKLQSTPASGYGSVCRFLSVSKKVGFKSYSSEWAAAVACRRQNEMFRIGFAPKASRRAFKVGDKWGYLTEKVEILTECFREDRSDERGTTLRSWAHEFGYHVMNQTGKFPTDLHPGNVGFLNGSLVLTDFMHPDEVYDEVEDDLDDCNLPESLKQDSSWSGDSSDSYDSYESSEEGEDEE